MKWAAIVLFCAQWGGCLRAAPGCQLLRSLSGPSGTAVGTRFELDSRRSRFTYPADKSFVVYFEWKSTAGTHVLEAQWKAPSGAVASLSPEVKLESPNGEVAAYWTYELAPTMASGIWNVEVRMDGEPCGSHPFELVIPKNEADQKVAPPPEPPSLDALYRQSLKSLVWVRRLDETGRRVDSGIGFVIGQNQVATAFQVIDSAATVQVEFADGRRFETKRIESCSRLQDWAVLQVDTGSAPILLASPDQPAVGSAYSLFIVEKDATATIGSVQLGGLDEQGLFGQRLHFNPQVPLASAGSPLLDKMGRVIGIAGGSMMPGSRYGTALMEANARLWQPSVATNGAVPFPAITQREPHARSLDECLRSGIFTAPLFPSAVLSYGGTARSAPRSVGLTDDAKEFSRKDKALFIYAAFDKKGKQSSVRVSVRIYDMRNKMLASSADKKVAPGVSQAALVSFSYLPSAFAPGTYRADLLVDGRPAMRNFFAIVE